MKDRRVIEIMVDKGHIPKTGSFIVNDVMLEQFIGIYGSLYKKVKKYKLTNPERKYAKKLAGLSLMKLNISRSEIVEPKLIKSKIEKPICGVVYLISNPAFPGMFKIGITQNLDTRLATYQTYDPLRRYKVEHYKFALDMRKKEAEILEKFKIDIVKGEWINNTQVKEIFKD